MIDAASFLLSEHELSQLITRWGAWLVFAAVTLQASGVPIPGTTVLVAAAIYAGSAHRLAIAEVIAAGALGAIVGYSISFMIGRSGGASLLKRYGHHIRLTPRRLRIGRYAFLRHGGKLVLFGRFVTGLRTWAGFLAGANRMPVGRFLLFNAIGAVAWAGLNGLGYFYFGHLLTGASTGLSVAFALLALGGLAASLIYARRQGYRLGVEADRLEPDPSD